MYILRFVFTWRNWQLCCRYCIFDFWKSHLWCICFESEPVTCYNIISNSKICKKTNKQTNKQKNKTKTKQNKTKQNPQQPQFRQNCRYRVFTLGDRIVCNLNFLSTPRNGKSKYGEHIITLHFNKSCSHVLSLFKMVMLVDMKKMKGKKTFLWTYNKTSNIFYSDNRKE